MVDKSNSKPGVYLIYCFANGKAYVGSSNKVCRRLASHRCDLRKDRHGNQHLQNAWNLYGEHEFRMGTVQTCDASELLVNEQIWLDIWVRSGLAFNRRAHAESPLGVKWTEEEKKAKSDAMRANPPFKGRKHTVESRAMLSAHAQLRTGAKNPFFGKSHSDATKKKVSSANSGNKHCVGRKFSSETRAKMSSDRKGRTISSDKHKAAARETQKRILCSPEVRKKAADKLRGIPRNPDTVAKMANSQRVRASALSHGFVGVLDTFFISPTTGERVPYVLNIKGPQK